MGVPMGAPYHQWKQVLADHGAVVRSSNYELYADMSARVMQTIRTLAPQMEIYSIDEAFCDLSDLPTDALDDFARTLRQRVLQWTGLPVSVGIAPTKTLAKLANHHAKKWMSSGTYIWPSEQQEVDRLLKNLPTQELWGVNQRTARKLGMLDVWTALDLKHADPRQIRQRFNVVMERMVRELNGMPCLQLEDVQPRKAIRSSKSFGKLQTEFDPIAEAVSHYMVRAATKLRNQESVTRAVMVMLRTNSFRQYHPQYRNRVIIPLDYPTQDTTELLRAARKGLKAIYRPHYRYHKAGVILLDLGHKDALQHDFFSTQAEDDPKRQNLMSAIDRLNDALGASTVTFLSQGIQRPWSMRCDSRSPRYTTRWDELARVE